MRTVFVDPPGAGKSTQAQRLARALPFWNTGLRLSYGEMVRAQIEAGADPGRYYERGEPVPDEKIVPLVLSRLTRAVGWTLDDFPANVARARVLGEELVARAIDVLGHPEDERFYEAGGGGRSS